MRARQGNLLFAGCALAALEIGWVLAREHGLFLSWTERLLYALTSACSLSLVVLGLGNWLAESEPGARFARAVRVAFALAAAALTAAMGWSLSEGRRVKDLTVRPYVVALLAALVLGVAWLSPGWLSRARASSPRLRWACVAVGFALALAALFADGLILARGYPAFHLGLALLAALCASLAGRIAPQLVASRRVLIASVLVALCAPFLLRRLATNPTAGFAVREHAPWTADLMAPFTPARAPRSRVAQQNTPPVSAFASGQVGVDLRDRDVLLITIDALRADLLRAYGGSGKTPELDRLADESAVFEHAYTPAPHTSYALASLLTGKFVKPLIELGEKLGDPPTLPDRLRRYGYRTAAFYPPAIFFVDGASFEALQKRGFGFEYRKEQFSTADQRVEELGSYLELADPKRPLFVWVHLFEPHEPYEPLPDATAEDSERARYEGEVARCDRAVAQLVARFRGARPRATVIVTADHGEEFGDHGGRFHGSTLFDEQARIPLLWSSPGVVAPQRIDLPVELTDVGTTILSTAAIPRDAHMRGDELGAALAGRRDGPRYAFASIAERQMVTDGRLKLICGARDAQCALFDLVEDPREQRSVLAARADDAEILRAQLDGFLSSIAEAEALTVSDGVRLPEPLARARLTGAVASGELTPLLGDARAAVRMEAARALGELGDRAALPALTQARAHDTDTQVRAEAAIATLALGDESALDGVLRVLASDAGSRRSAALALARFDRAEAVPVLAQLVHDEAAAESARLRALHALAGIHDESALAPLIDGLEYVRLRESAAVALGQHGGQAAAEALQQQLHEERYPPARAAELAALMQLAARDPASQLRLRGPLENELRRYLGMESSVPFGVRQLAALGALDVSDARGALLSDPKVRAGSWRCTEAACIPERDAALVLPKRGASPRGPQRVTVWYRDAVPGSALLVDGQRFVLATREDQFSLLSTHPGRVAFASEGEASVIAVVVSPALAEIPPPPPEPWDAGSEKPPLR